MPHIFLLILVVFGLVYGIFKFFVFMLDTFVLLDERFVSNIKEKDSDLLNYFLAKDEDDSLDESTRIKIKRVNTALRYDFFISTLVFYGLSILFPLFN